MSIQIVRAVKSSAGRRIGVFLWGLGLSLAAVASPGLPQLAPSAAFPPTSQPGDALTSAEAPAAPTSHSQTVAPGETPKGIAPEAWSNIMADVQARTYAVQPDKTDSLLAGNPAQHLAARFSSRDVALTPEQRTRPTPGKHVHAPQLQPGTPFELRTRSVDGIPTQAVTPVATANRVEYHHAGYTEWYVNEAKGFEQGWTLDAPAADGKSPLIRIGVTGARTVAEEPDAIRIEDSRGKLRYRYAGLKVTDAAQRTLPARLRLAQPGLIEIAVDDRGAQYPVTVDPALTVTQAVTLSDPGATNGDDFGQSVAVNGDNVVVGAPSSNNYQGVVYIYNRNQGGAGAWGKAATLSDPAATAYNYFGESVAVNGSTLVVGAYGVSTRQGAAYIYSLSQSSGSWGLAASLSDPAATINDNFGNFVAVDGDTVVVAAPGSGTQQSQDQGEVYIYGRNQGGAGTWGKVASLTDPAATPLDFFGSSASVIGDTLVVGAPGTKGQGAAYVFSRNQGGAGAWGEAASLIDPLPKDGGRFGSTVAVDGDTVVVGAFGAASDTSSLQGVAYIYSRNQGGTGIWGRIAILSEPGTSTSTGDGFGRAVAVNGDNVVVAAYCNGTCQTTSTGITYVFNRNQGGAGLWGLAASLSIPSSPDIEAYEYSVAVDGDTVVVGSDGVNNQSPGAAYVFDISGGTFTKAAGIAGPANGTAFGYSVAVDGDTAVVGLLVTNGGNGGGAAYIYSRNQGGAGRWGLAVSLSDPLAMDGDEFGTSVAVDGDTVGVGAAGTYGMEGAAYVYSRNQGGVGRWGLAASLSDPGATVEDSFGYSVAVNGDTLVVGSPQINSNFGGAAYIYSRNQGGAGLWGRVASLSDPGATSNDIFGFDVALYGDTVIVGAAGFSTYQGAAYIYSRNQGGAGRWGLAATLSDPAATSGDYYGLAVAVNGDTVAVGSNANETYQQGVAYIYDRNQDGAIQNGASAWVLSARLSDPPAINGDFFGWSVAVDGDTVVVGAPVVGAPQLSSNQGVAYIFSRNQGGAGQWGQLASLSDPAAQVGDNFGFSVAVSGGTVVVGARNTGSNAQGAAYIYSLATDLPTSIATPTSLKFAPQASGTSSAAQTVTLKNTGSGDLTVSSLSFSGTHAADFAVFSNGCGAAVAPGGSCTVQVEFSPTGTTPGTLTATLDIASNAPDSPNKIALSGSLILPPTVTPTTLAFGDVAVGNTAAAKTVTLENHEATAISVSTAISGSGFAISGGTCGSTLAAGKDCTVLVTFAPAALGAVTGTLTLTDSPDSNSPHSIALSGIGSTQTTVTPASLAFGSLMVSETSAAKTVTLENHETTAISVSTAISGTGFAISGGTCGSTLAAGKDCTVLVTFAPLGIGNVTGTLTLSDGPDSASPHSIALSGKGTPRI